MNYKDESPKLELKLNLSPPRDNRGPGQELVWAHEPGSSTEISPRSSCVSRESSPNDEQYSSSPESMRNMILVGCPRCLMYVMLMEEDPKCPKCKSTVLLDFMQEDRNNMGLKK
ncbi:Unknown protein [Striga hermonthica]|uniref:GIR1-like zinc ribbon domain-containing protein n=1 Tax=Striga hermonthica TaxID=68872 RepID=A0A9N7RM88_STRHE|nr:Unknown protein [Striga hermonthica]